MKRKTKIVYALSSAEKKAILQGLKDIKKGKIQSHDSVISNANKLIASFG